MIFYNDIDLRDDEIHLLLVAMNEAVPEKKWVPSYGFDICLLDGTKVGICNLKIDNTELTKYCGNIGYSIIENYRGNKYSLRASKLLLKLAQMHNLKYVAITCAPDNFASNRICELLGAKFIENVFVPESHEMYSEYKKLNIYKIEL